MSGLCDAVWLIVCVIAVSGQLSYEPNSSEEFIFTPKTSVTTTAPLRTSPETPLRTTTLSDVTISLPEISQTPTRTSKFKVGDHVRIITDVERIRSLQKDHGGWFPSMLSTLGQKGLVEEIDDDENLRVMVSGTFWTFNPMSVTKVAESQDLKLSVTQRSTRQLTEVFRDDFNDQSIDNKKWTSYDFNCTLGVQRYTSDDVWEESGYMFIRSQRRKYGGRNFTSGTVDTQKKFEFLYGEVEWRAKLSGGQGITSFLMIQFSGIPNIAITARGDYKDMVVPIVNCKSQLGTSEISYRNVYGADDTVGNFHTFKIIWEPEQIIWLVDGRQVWNITDSEKIPNQEGLLDMRLIVGQAWTGLPDSTTPFPTRMLIDYVSVHQWK